MKSQSPNSFQNCYNLDDVIAFHQLQVSKKENTATNSAGGSIENKITNKITQLGNSLQLQITVNMGSETLTFCNQFEFHNKMAKPLESFILPAKEQRRADREERKLYNSLNTSPSRQSQRRINKVPIPNERPALKLIDTNCNSTQNLQTKSYIPLSTQNLAQLQEEVEMCHIDDKETPNNNQLLDLEDNSTTSQEKKDEFPPDSDEKKDEIKQLSYLDQTSLSSNLMDNQLHSKEQDTSSSQQQQNLDLYSSQQRDGDEEESYQMNSNGEKQKRKYNKKVQSENNLSFKPKKIKVKKQSQQPQYESFADLGGDFDEDDAEDDEYSSSISFQLTPCKILNVEELKQFGIFTNRKNAVKNIVKAFHRYLLLPQHEKELLDEPNIGNTRILRDIRKCVNRLERKRKYNQQLIYNIYSQDKVNYAFRLFLRNHAQRWLTESKIQDQDVYMSVLKDYLHLFNEL